MGDAIGLLSNLPVAVNNNALRVAANSYERVMQALTTTAGAYDASDVIGGLITLQLSKAGWESQFLYVYDAVGDNPEIDIYVFNEAPTVIADNAPLALAAADIPKLVNAYAPTFLALVAGTGWIFQPVGAGIVGQPIPLIGDTLYVYLTMRNGPLSLTATDSWSVVLLAKG